MTVILHRIIASLEKGWRRDPDLKIIVHIGAAHITAHTRGHLHHVRRLFTGVFTPPPSGAFQRFPFEPRSSSAGPGYREPPFSMPARSDSIAPVPSTVRSIRQSVIP